MRHSKNFFVLFTCLGIAILGIIIVNLYLNWIDSLNILATLDLEQFGIPLLISGVTFLTIGILGLDWKNVQKYRKRFVALYVVLIPLTTIVCFFLLLVLVFFFVPMFPLRSEITNMAVVSNNPLVLSVDARALTSRTSRIDGAIIISDNGTLVAQTDFNARERFEHEDYTGLALAVLPGGSEITVTLNFNTTLAYGDYVVSLSTWGDNHGRSIFTIP